LFGKPVKKSGRDWYLILFYGFVFVIFPVYLRKKIPMRRILIYTYVAAAFALAAYSTITVTWPAVYIVDLLTSGNRYPMMLSMMLTTLMLLSPLLLVVFILNRIRIARSANAFRTTMPGAGIIVRRKSHIMDYLNSWKLYSNGQQLGSISAGEVKYFPLDPGQATLMVKGGKRYSHDLTVTIVHGRALSLETGVIAEKAAQNKINAPKDILYLKAVI